MRYSISSGSILYADVPFSGYLIEKGFDTKSNNEKNQKRMVAETDSKHLSQYGTSEIYDCC